MPHQSFRLCALKFNHVGNAQSPRRVERGVADGNPTGRNGNVVRPRSYSHDESENLRQEDFVNRMKTTLAYKVRGFKGNTRGQFIQQSFTTLDEILRTLPDSLGFNIEISKIFPILVLARRNANRVTSQSIRCCLNAKPGVWTTMPLK